MNSSEADRPPRIAFIGLGNMGQPMSRRLHEAGYAVTAYDVSAAARQSAAASGVAVADVLIDAVGGADILILMLPTSEVVTDVLLGQGALAMLAKPATVIDMGSSNPVATRRLAAVARESGRVLVDAPVSGGVGGAMSGTLTVMVGGDAADLEPTLSVLSHLGSRVSHVGPTGAGHALKAINNLLSATHLLVSSEALLVGHDFGLSYESMLDVINHSSGRSASTENKWPKFVLPASYDSGFSLALMTKDMTIALALAEELGWASALSKAATELWQRAARETPQGTDHTAIVEWLRAQRLPA